MGINWPEHIEKRVKSKEFAEEYFLLDITELISEHADSLGLSYKELAELAGISSRSMSRYMSGETDFPFRKLVDIFFVTGFRMKISIEKTNKRNI